MGARSSRDDPRTKVQVAVNTLSPRSVEKIIHKSVPGGILGPGVKKDRVAHTIICVLECWEAKSILLEGEEP